MMYPNENIRPDFSRSGFLVRLVYAIFDWLESIVETVVVSNPIYTAMDTQNKRIYEELEKWGSEKRAQYPERYAKADAQMRRRYLHLDA